MLPLAELGTDVGDGSVTDLLREHDHEIFAFFLSFVVIAQLWFAQHHVVSSLVSQDPLALPATGYWPLLLLFLADPLAQAWRRARGSGSAPARVGR